jgi:endonuclease-3 related protein
MKTPRARSEIGRTGRRIFLEALYEAMNRHYGDLGWWPAETPFEVTVGAILTQNTAWRNVTVAITNMKEAGIMSPARIMAADEEKIAGLIRPAGYYHVKTRRLKSFVRYLTETHAGSLEKMFAGSWQKLRDALLDVHGIGRETADSILLYAGGKPVFVVDAYTSRILNRHGVIAENADYNDVQKLFMDNLPANVELFNQYHALIVNTGKDYCIKRNPRCDRCPLQGIWFRKKKR